MKKDDVMMPKLITGIAILVMAGCTGRLPDVGVAPSVPTQAERAIAQLKPGMLQSQVEELLGVPAKVVTNQATGLPVTTYYLDLSTNYPGVLAKGKCLMTVHYDGQWAGLTFVKIEGPHYPDE